MGVFDSIEPSWLEQFPTPDMYPTIFNSSCKDMWGWCCSQVDSTSPRDSWYQCVTLFIDRCYEAGREPLVDPAEDVNDRIYDSLKAQYREVVSLLTKLPLSLKEVREKCIVNDIGFTIQIDYKYSNAPISLENTLLGKGFTVCSLGLEYKSPKGATVLISLVEDFDCVKGNVNVSFMSDVNPIITDDYIPSVSQLQNFILQVMLGSIRGMSNHLRN